MKRLSFLMGAFLALSGASFVQAQTPAPAVSAAQGITLSNLSSQKVNDATVVYLELDKPIQGTIPSFALASPPRLVIDLPGVQSAVARVPADLATGDVRQIQTAQSGNKTRVVLSLVRSVPFLVFTKDTKVLVVINPPVGANFSALDLAKAPVGSPAPAAAAAGTAAAPVAPKPTALSAVLANATPAGGKPLVASNVAKSVTDINFRRAEDGAGRVIIDLSDSASSVDIKTQGNALMVELDGVSLPERLRRRMDVTDFATPVNRVVASSAGSNSRVMIEPGKGLWEHSAYQTDNRLVIELRAVKEDPNKLVQGSKVGYKGDRLSLNFQNIGVRELLQVFADFTNFNIVTSDTVQGTITLRLKDVPWDQALDIVMQSKGLDSRKNGNVVIIAPREELVAKEKLELESKQQINNLEPIRSEVFQLQYQRAEDIRKMISDNQSGGGGTDNKISSRFLSQRGTAAADTRTNQLFVSDTGTKIEEVRRLLGKIDIPIRQVMIEARIVEAGDTFGKSLGVKLGFNDRRSSIFQTVTLPNGSTVNVPVYGAGSNIAGSGIFGTISGNQQGAVDLSSQLGTGTNSGSATAVGLSGGTAIGNTNFVNLPAPSVGGAASPASFAISLFGSSLTRFLNLEISALEADGKGKIVSSPRVVTSDATKALIESGTEYPYLIQSGNSVAVSFKKAVLKLEVTPQITPEGNVILDVDVSKDSRGETTLNGPAINTKHIKTQVLVENGGTVVIGGIYQQEETTQQNKVPFFGDLPFVGALFRNSSRQTDKQELLIFITPKVMQQGALAEKK